MTESPPQPVGVEPTVQVNRWKRNGKDRLYVSLSDETKLGFWDLVADEPHPETPECLARLSAAAESWWAGRGQPPAPRVTVPVEPLAEPPAKPWIDLSHNLPGAQPRVMAEAARDAAPVRTAVARVFGFKTDERAWRIGADGEEMVAAKLAKVAKKDARWQFLHSIPVGSRGSDIDHVVVGPGGVFSVNTKHHPGKKIWVGGDTFLVNGHRKPYVRNSRHEATRAAKLLSEVCGFEVHVEGLIVVVNAADVVIKSQPFGVSVTSRNRAARWLLRQRDVLSDQAIASIYDAARRSTSWR